jgi:hypothetical protein
MTEEGPRDRAVCMRSKKALVQTRGEGAKQFAFTNGPFGWATKQVMSEITEGFAEVFRPIGKCFYDVERLRECEDSRQSKQKLLPNSMAGP